MLMAHWRKVLLCSCLFAIMIALGAGLVRVAAKSATEAPAGFNTPSSQCADVFCRGYGLLGFRADSAIVDNGSSGNRVFPVIDKDCRVNEIAIFIIVPNPEFRDLTCGPTIRILMTSDATRRVVYRSKTSRDRLVFLINLLVQCKRVSVWLDDSVANAVCTIEAGSI